MQQSVENIYHDNKNKKVLENKKNTPKKSTLKPVDDEFSKLDAKKILEKEEKHVS